MSENSDHADKSDDDDENLQTDTPSLMYEIRKALEVMAIPEVAVFKVDDSEEYSE